MRVRKTRKEDRSVYRYPVSVDDGKGGYRTVYRIIKPGVDGVTEDMIKLLHSMDDSEVYNNIKNGHPNMTEEQKTHKREWEEAHPGEKYPMDWNLSLDYVFGENGDTEFDKSKIMADISYYPFFCESNSVIKLREIVAEKMTERQRQAYQLIGIEGYSCTEAAKIMGVSIKVAKVHYDKAIECIKKYF